MKSKFFLAVIVLIALVACNGGGGNIPPGSGNTPSTELVPLNITVSDLNDKPLANDTIDVYKIGQVMKYKLTFTNPNHFAVSRPLDGGINSGANVGADVNWADANNKLSQPGNGDIAGNFYKTNNADDCFNVSQLNSGQSCSFYSIAQHTFNTTAQEYFSYPIAYVITQISDVTNKLVVQQCQKRYPGAVPQYDCSNETKPGYANQFIKYKLVSTTTPFPYPSNQGFQFSNDGKYMAYCIQNYYPATCYKQSATYNSTVNSLTFNTVSTLLPKSGQLSLSNGFALLSADGTSFFGTMILSGGIYRIINSIQPNTPSIDSLGTNNLSEIEEIQGLDNSIMINNTGAGRAYKYDPLSNKIPDIKIDGNFATYVYGATSDGTLIMLDGDNNLRCANSTDGINYTSRSMTNFVNPTTDKLSRAFMVFQVHNIFYAYQDLTLTHVNGNSYRTGAYLKINADSRHCSIAIADANTVSVSDITFEDGVSVYDDYVNIGSKLTSVNNTVLGFN